VEANIGDEFFDSQENFEEPRTWWHGRDSSCEGEEDSDDGEDIDTNLEGGGLEDILTWSPEFLFHCDEHARWRRKARKGVRSDRSYASTSREASVGDDDGREGHGAEARPEICEGAEGFVLGEGERGGFGEMGCQVGGLGGPVGPVGPGAARVPTLATWRDPVLGERATNYGAGFGENGMT
jgi:hypothetical protein